MKVDNIHNVLFSANEAKIKTKSAENSSRQIKELSPVTPDFAVKTPQKYSKIGIYDLDNGLKLHTYKLANGMKVSLIPMQGSPCVVKSYVNVGSLNETPDIKGISHFLEHMAFNGTNGENGHMKLEIGDSFKKVEELGGWANASTNYAVTDYVNSTPLLNNSDLEQQIKIIAAMSEDLTLSDEMVEKEKYAVCSEINMILDDPQTIALDKTVRATFNIDNPADEMVGGSVNHIKNLTRKDVVDYYNKYYTPDNMNVVITGDINPDEAIQLVAKHFTSRKLPKGEKFDEKLTPITKTHREDIYTDKATSAEIVIGFAGPKNNDKKERIIYELAEAYLTSYATGIRKSLKPYNSSMYIDCEKISTNPNSPRFIYLGSTSSEENYEKVLKTITSGIENVEKPTEEVLKEIKQNIISAKEDVFEYSSNVNNVIGSAVLNNDIDYIVGYNELLNSITPEEVYAGIKKYFDVNKAAITIIHPKNTENISFKGKREPINQSMVKEYTLDNNFNVGIYKTNNKNINYKISLYTQQPYNKKAGVTDVLNEMLSMGTKTMDDNEIVEFQEKNNIKIKSGLGFSSMQLSAQSSFENRDLIYKLIKEKLYEPRLTEENLEKAKCRLKDYLSRTKTTAYSLYLDYSSKFNPYDFSLDEVLGNIDNITLDDVKDAYNHILANSRGIVTANVPASNPEVEKEILNLTNELKDVLPNHKQLLELYTQPEKPVVLTYENNNSQADIIQVNKFKYDNTIKTDVLLKLINSLLSNSSIGLFNTLRERDHLAYSVFSDVQVIGDSGEISCNILTTTDNKEIGEFSYDNVQKSIDGFNNQINALKSGEFTDKDLENAKLALKASLLNKEGVNSKLNSLNSGLNSKYGIDYANKLFTEIDNLSREDVINFAEKIFANPPIYSITATKDTLEYNKNYLAGLEA